MLKLLIGSPKFEGTVEVVYNSEELLHSISFSGVSLTIAHKAKFLLMLSNAVHVSQLQPAFASTTVSIASAEFEVTFVMFWHEYPYKRNRHIAEPLFNKLPKTDQIQAWESAKEYAKYLKREAWCKAKLADLWLKTKQYLNDWKNL